MNVGVDVSRETSSLFERYEELVRSENKRHNLVSSTTLDEFQTRHVADSLQLKRWLPDGQTVCDIGSGAGLPGIVLACLRSNPVTMVEPRKLRADFLKSVVAELSLDAAVIQAKAESVRGSFDAITARAVAALDKLIPMTLHLAHPATTWVLPKGKNAHSELEVLKRKWHCDVAEVPSVTSPDARILILKNLKAKAGR